MWRGQQYPYGFPLDGLEPPEVSPEGCFGTVQLKGFLRQLCPGETPRILLGRTQMVWRRMTYASRYDLPLRFTCPDCQRARTEFCNDGMLHRPELLVVNAESVVKSAGMFVDLQPLGVNLGVVQYFSAMAYTLAQM